MKKITFILTALAAVGGMTSSVDAQTAYGLGSTGLTLSSFDIATPGTFAVTVPLIGLSVGETISAIDFRPSNQLLYGYSSLNNLYTIDYTSGTVTLNSTFTTVASTPTTGTTGDVGSDMPSTFPPRGSISIDVNPNVPLGGAVGALRIVSTSGGNYRYAFSNTTLNLDDTLTYSTGGVPQVVSVAYTNPDTNTATGTALYYLDATTDSLYTTTVPNDGLLTLVGSLGVGIDIPTSGVGFDVPLFGTNNAFASINSNLYSINLGTGAATLIGASGSLAGISDIAVVPEPSTYVMLALGGLGLFALARRARSMQA